VRSDRLRDAATVMVVRDAAHAGCAIEVLMLRRRTGASFAGGAHVFPGGAVDPSDKDPATGSFSEGRGDQELSDLLAVDSGGLAYFVAAIRECFEEAGLLFAEDSGGMVSFLDPAARQRYERYRCELNAGTTTLAEICRSEALMLAVDRLRYVSHWITPLGSPRRFDTRFFVGIAPEEQAASHDGAEVVESEWVVPAEALDRHRAGALDLLFPTVKHLEFLARFRTAEELWSSPPAEIPAIEPRITADGPAVRIILPGEPGFEEATGLPEGMDFPDRPLGSLGA
jgi:8-oxo-dGTP pyrophosphatase MutT (NUDIX family)